MAKRLAQRDNSIALLKSRVRQEIARKLTPDARVLEFFAGEGALFRAVWHRFRGATMDKVEAKADGAARERPGWAVYQGDTLAAVRGGWMGHAPFDVVDIDAWGEPWKFLKAWMESPRLRAPVTEIALTDGLMSRSSLVRCNALWGDAPPRAMSRAEYLQSVRDRLNAWADAGGMTIDAMQTWTAGGSCGMAQHRLTIRAPERPDPAEPVGTPRA